MRKVLSSKEPRYSYSLMKLCLETEVRKRETSKWSWDKQSSMWIKTKIGSLSHITKNKSIPDKLGKSN
jgi:hypothetical protein